MTDKTTIPAVGETGSAQRPASVEVATHVAPSAQSAGSGHSFKPISEEQRRWHTCLRKAVFNQIEHAYAARNRQGLKQSATVYQCPYCSLWHLTSKKELATSD